MSEEHLTRRLRAAVTSEAAAVADDGLADRLLHGAARRKRRDATAVVGVAAVVAAASVLVGISLLTGAGDTLTGPDTAGAPDLSRLSVQQAGAVTVEQAGREGVDGTAACLADAITAPPPQGAGVAPGLSLYAAYLTDANRYEQWTTEYTGALSVPADAPAESPALLAVCWFAGDVPADLSAGPQTAPATHQLVVVHVSEEGDLARLRLDARSPRPLPVLAPPPPADPPAGATTRAFPQPSGVQIVDELPTRPEPVPAEPVDCVPTACADPNEEVVVRADALLDGQPIDPRATLDLTPGQTVSLQLTLDVEDGQTINDVHFALSDGNIGAGPDGPIGLGQILAREPAVTGARTFDATWTAPDNAQAQQLVLYYLSDKHQPGAAHTRTLGGLAVRPPSR